MSTQKRIWLLIPGGNSFAKKSGSDRLSNTQLMPDTIDWPPSDVLWQTIRDPGSKAYFKFQSFIEEYQLTIKEFLACLGLVVHGFYQDQLMVIFLAIFPSWYNITEKSDKICMSELFESGHTWVESKLIEKLKLYSNL